MNSSQYPYSNMMRSYSLYGPLLVDKSLLEKTRQAGIQLSSSEMNAVGKEATEPRSCLDRS